MPAIAKPPIDADCDFVAQYSKLNPPDDPFPFGTQAAQEKTRKDARFLSRSVVLHSVGIPRALDVLHHRLQAGEIDLCDDELFDAIDCRQQRIVRGDHPTAANVAMAGSSVLGIPSPLAAGVATNASAAALRCELLRAIFAIACGEDHEVNCAQARFLSLNRRYIGGIEFSLTDAARSLIRKEAVARNYDEQFLQSDTVKRVFGGPCGEDEISVALGILDRPRSEVLAAQERLAYVNEFSKLLDLPNPPTPSDVETFVGLFPAMVSTNRPTGCLEPGADWTTAGRS
jgi:hypothetical protein